MSTISNLLDHFFGRGEAAVTVPTMDGALRPNTELDQLAGIGVEAPDSLAFHQGATVVAMGTRVVRLSDQRVLHEFQEPVTAMASHIDRLAVAVQGQGLFYLTEAGVLAETECVLHHITALSGDGNDLLICEGSARFAPSGWRRCLMERGAYGADDGSVYRLSPQNGLTRIAHGLAWPCGAVATADGTIIVSEAWKSRLISLAEGKVVLADLPGYPGRLVASANGGFWLAVFAPRSQLLEFVLREDRYRRRMIDEIDPAYWIAPALSNGRSFLEPLQGGGVKQMGVLKPWAPTRSYGLLVRLDEKLTPVSSLHSRADGERHGITDVSEEGDVLRIACKGGNEVLSASINTGV